MQESACVGVMFRAIAPLQASHQCTTTNYRPLQTSVVSVGRFVNQPDCNRHNDAYGLG